MRNTSQTTRRTPFPAENLHGSRAGAFLVCTAALSLLLFSGGTAAFAQAGADAQKNAVTQKPASETTAQGSAAADSEKQAVTYPDKDSGDRARAQMEYGAAASFYRLYRAKAEKAGDSAAVKDAYACELDALILANLADSAKKLLDEYCKNNPKTDEKSINLWQAEIYLIQRKADEADKLLKKLIPSLENLDPALLRALSCAAFVAELKGDQEQAAKYYGDIAAKVGVKTSFGRRAVERQALALAALGKFPDAYTLLKTLPVVEDKRNVDAIRLLNFYLTLSEKGPESLADDWSEIRSISTSQKDNFFFLAACRIGDEFLRRGETVRAAEAFHLAYGFAAVREDSFTAMQRLMNAFDRLGDKKEAADLAMRMISFFKDIQLSPDFKLRIASILFRADRTKDAFDVCMSCISDASASAADREKIYRNALDVMIREKAFPSAYRFIDAFDTVPDKKSARAMDRAEVTWREDKPAEAAKLYRAVGESARGALRQEALLNAMRCCRDAKQYQEMLDIAALLRKDDPQHPAPDMLLLSAVAQFHLRDLAAAAKNYLDYEASVPKTEENRQYREQALLQAGQLLSSLGKPAEAAEVFRRLCRDYDLDDGAARYWLIHCLYASKNEEEAKKEADRFFEEKPDSQYAEAAMLRQAEHYRSKSLAENAEDPENARNAENAKQTLDKLLNQDKYPKIQARARYEKALIEFQRNDLAAALESLDQIDISDPANAPVADIHYLRGDIARAENVFAKARIEYEAAAKAAVAGSRLQQAALGSVADCIYALAENPPTETAVAASSDTTASAPQDKDKTKDAADGDNGKDKPKDTADGKEKDSSNKSKDAPDAKEKEGDKAKDSSSVKPAAPPTPADNYREAFKAYQALLEVDDLLPEYKAMAIYKSGQALWKAGDEKEAFNLFNQMIFLLPAEESAARPAEAFWVFRAVEALESIALKEIKEIKYKDHTVSAHVDSAKKALDWLGRTGKVEKTLTEQRKRALDRAFDKKSNPPTLPASSNTNTTPESSQS